MSSFLRISTYRGVMSIADHRILTVNSETTVADVSKKMLDEDVRNLFVVKDGKPIGVVRDIDIVFKVVARDLNPNRVRAEQITLSPAPILDHKARVLDAARIMVEKRVRRILLMDREKIVGSVSAGDVLKELSYIPTGDNGETIKKLTQE